MGESFDQTEKSAKRRRISARRKREIAKRREREKEKRIADAQKRKEEREAEKGRKSLRGLSVYGWSAALDRVMSGEQECPYPSDERSIKARHMRKWFYYTSFTDEHAKLHPSYLKNQKADGTLFSVAYCRVMYARPEMHEQMKEAFGCKWVHTFQMRNLSREELLRDVNGPLNKRVLVLAPVYPADKVYSLFAAIWPDKWQHFAEMYIEGYTAKAVEAFGLGEYP